MTRNHSRPSSISSYHASRVPSGFSIRPKSNGGRSSALRPVPCDFCKRVWRTNRSSSASSFTISDPPTQGEVQALRDKSEELPDDVRALATLVHTLLPPTVDLVAELWPSTRARIL
jgi:hypothetical protein